MSSSSSTTSMPVLFEDMFETTEINPEGKKFEKVSRVVAHSENYDMDLILDINSEIYRLNQGQKFTLVLAKTLNLDGSADSKVYNQDSTPSLADNYEYVMYGKVFKIISKSDQKQLVEIYISYGGLLMCLKGDSRNLPTLDPDMRVYLLIKKISTSTTSS
eukprot:TRINITY_DN51_c0_g1_i1.p1 TRINITY_DN51_c0_g1~~TRINITY_DN51_c0_g1_i1.p1  ORF type:complete len:160 (-),score=21.64 TRINITY_DN51_c0_g1_i1:494-973(-)